MPVSSHVVLRRRSRQVPGLGHHRHGSDPIHVHGLITWLRCPAQYGSLANELFQLRRVCDLVGGRLGPVRLNRNVPPVAVSDYSIRAFAAVV